MVDGGTIGGKSVENEWKIGKNFAQNRRSVLPGSECKCRPIFMKIDWQIRHR